MLKVLNRDEIVQFGDKLVSPFEKECLTPIGYDLRAGQKMVNFRTAIEEKLKPKSTIIIPPGERFAVETLEKIKLNNKMFAFVFTKVGVLWEGLTSLGTKIDPGFSDNMWLVFANDSSRPYNLEYGSKLCNVMFFEYDNPAEDIPTRSRPSVVVFPPQFPSISDALAEEEIQRNFGFDILEVVNYFRPKLDKYARKIRHLEKFKRRVTYFVVSVATAVISGLIIWLLTRG